MEGIDKDAFGVIPSVATSQSIVQLVVLDPQRIDFETKEEMVIQVRFRYRVSVFVSPPSAKKHDHRID